MHDLRATFSAAPDGGYLARLIEPGAEAGSKGLWATSERSQLDMVNPPGS